MATTGHRRVWLPILALAALLVAGRSPAAAEEGLERGTLRFGGRERAFVVHEPAQAPDQGEAEPAPGAETAPPSGTPAHPRPENRPGQPPQPIGTTPHDATASPPATAPAPAPDEAAAEPTLRPAVFVLHGGLGTGAQVAEFTGFNALADRDGFLVVYPDGIGRQWNDGREGGPARPEIDDVGFLTALAERMVEEHGADPHRLYVAGVSNGGMMTLRLACERPRRFAAFAAVIANLPRALRTTCRPEVPVSLIVINGTADPLVPFEGGGVGFLGGRGAVISARDTVGLFVDRDGCRPLPETTVLPDPRRDDSSRVRRLWHRDCRDGSEVLFYIVEGGGHTWPGRPVRALPRRLVGPTNLDIDATALIWEFFQRHPRP